MIIVHNLTLADVRATDVRDMGSSPIGCWHNSSTDNNPKRLHQLSSSPSKLPVIFKIHPQRKPQARIMYCNRTFTNVSNQNKSKKSVTTNFKKYIWGGGVELFFFSDDSIVYINFSHFIRHCFHPSHLRFHCAGGCWDSLAELGFLGIDSCAP